MPRRLPSHWAALIDALRLKGADPEALRSFDEHEWKQTLAFCDRTQLTLALGAACNGILPGWVRDRIAGDAARNAERWRRIRAAYEEIAAEFTRHSIEHAVLKGFAHCPEFVREPAQRVQYDIDLLLRREDVLAARDILLPLRYEALKGLERLPVDHLPVMIRRTGWRWRGDYFDPEIPPEVELHFRLWDGATERFAPAGLEAFFDRRGESVVDDDLRFPALELADRVGYASLHLLRHLLRGDLRPGHVYELACFLDLFHDDADFWLRWRQLHSDSLRQLELICFRIADVWFHCRIPAPALEQLPDGIERWLNTYALAPLEGLVSPNKDELWLHLSLVNNAPDRFRIIRRRLLPLQVPGPAEGVEVPEAQRTRAFRLSMRWSQGRRILARTRHHARALVPVIVHGVRWWWEGLGVEPAFWRFLAAAALFELGMFVFILLFNLFLTEAGFRETSLGLIAGAMTAGNLAGVLPAGLMVQRLKPNLVLCAAFLMLAVVSALRVTVSSEAALIGLSFLSGSILSLWAVSILPAISSLTAERSRSIAFSSFVATGIGVGVAGGMIGGQLPGWLGRLGAVHPKQTALLLACALMALSAVPAFRLRIARPPREQKLYPRNPVLIRFLSAWALWSLAVGVFNPFFNVYFSKHLSLSVERIGWAFSAAQFLQVLAVLGAPAVFRRFGLSRGIAGMQASTGLALLFLAIAPSPVAVLAYTLYMVFQCMSEPGVFTLLMNGVQPAERGGASALIFFVAYAAQAVAAAAGGVAFTHLGYPLPLSLAAAGALLAAVLFARLPDRTQSSSTSQISS